MFTLWGQVLIHFTEAFNLASIPSMNPQSKNVWMFSLGILQCTLSWAVILWTRSSEMRLQGNKMVINGGRFHGLQAGCGDGDWNSHLKDTGLGQSPVLPWQTGSLPSPPLCPTSSLPFVYQRLSWQRQRMKDGGETASFRSLIFNQVTGSPLGEKSRRCKRGARKFQRLSRKQDLWIRYRSQPTSANF